MGKVQKNATHSPNFGIGLRKRCREVGIGCEVMYPGADVKHKTTANYLVAALRE